MAGVSSPSQRVSDRPHTQETPSGNEDHKLPACQAEFVMLAIPEGVLH